MFIKAKDSNKPFSVATLSLKMYFIGLLTLAFFSTSSLANICVDQWGFYPNPDDPNCHSFIQCQWGNPYVVNCPTGLVYNPNYKYCDWPYNYEGPGNTGGMKIVYYVTDKQSWLITVWKFQDFSVIQILRESDFGECSSTKIAFFAVLNMQALNMNWLINITH